MEFLICVRAEQYEATMHTLQRSLKYGFRFLTSDVVEVIKEYHYGRWEVKGIKYSTNPTEIR